MVIVVNPRFRLLLRAGSEGTRVCNSLWRIPLFSIEGGVTGVVRGLMPGYGFWQLRSVVLAVAGTALCCNPAFAQSLEAALAYAYANNPQLNAQRAQVRATDENVPTALAGYRPRAIDHRERRLAVAVDHHPRNQLDHAAGTRRRAISRKAA